MAIRMQQRRGTTQQWTDANPVLSVGEIGFETNTNKFKIGDGVSRWEDLDYFVSADGIPAPDYTGLATEEYVDDAIAAIPTVDISGKQDKVTGVSDTEIGYLDGVTSAIQTQLDSKLESTDLDGYATEEYVDTAVSNLVASAPEALDTLNELAAALGNDENFATTVTNSIANKASSENPEFSVVGTLVYETAAGLDVSATGVRPGEILLDYSFEPNSVNFEDFDLSPGQTIKLVGTQSNGLEIDLLEFEIVSYSNGQMVVYPANPLEVTRVTDFIAANPGTTSYATPDVPDTVQAYDKTVTAMEVGYLNGVTSAIQTQLDAKAATSHTHVIADVTGLQTALDAKPSRPTVSAKTSAYTLTTADAGNIIEVETQVSLPTTWTSRSSNFGTNKINAITYGNGLWVAGGYSGQVRTSTNGITWTTRNSNFGTDTINQIVYGNGLWAMTSYESASFRISTDAVTWTTATTGFGNTQPLNFISYGNGLWLTSDPGGSSSYYTSTNLTTWTTRIGLNAGTRGMLNAVYSNNIWLAQDNNFYDIYRSTDGITWTSAISRPPIGFNKLAYGNGLWIGGDASGGSATYSSRDNGLTWNAIDGIPTNFADRSISYGSGVWLVSGTDFRQSPFVPAMFMSTNGSTWSTVTTGFTTSNSEFMGATYGGSLWVAVGGLAWNGSSDLRTSPSSRIATTVTVPPDSSQNFPVGSSVDLVNTGIGELRITEGTGVSVFSNNGSRSITSQYSSAKLYKRSSNTWTVSGSLSD